MFSLETGHLCVQLRAFRRPVSQLVGPRWSATLVPCWSNAATNAGSTAAGGPTRTCSPPSASSRVLWDLSIEGVDERVLQTRPSPEQWSIAEYADHVRETLFGARFLVDSAVSSPGVDLGSAPPSRFETTARRVDLPAVLDRMGDEAEQLRDRLRATPVDEWPLATVTFDGRTVDLGWIGRHAIHDASHHLHDVGRIRVGLGARGAQAGGHRLAPRGVGRGRAQARGRGVHRRMVGRGRRHAGRPPPPRPTVPGVVPLEHRGHRRAPGRGPPDRSRPGRREHHCRPGLDWATLRPGTIVRIGGVLAEISSHATPCAKNAQWFADRAFSRIDHDVNPGLSRLYASVLEPGPVAVGDRVVVEP